MCYYDIRYKMKTSYATILIIIFWQYSLICGSRDIDSLIEFILQTWQLIGLIKIKTFYIKFSNRCMLVENGHCLWRFNTQVINFKLFTIKYVNILNIVLGNILSVSLWCLRNVAEAAVLTVAAAPFRNDGHFVYQRLL